MCQVAPKRLYVPSQLHGVTSQSCENFKFYKIFQVLSFFLFTYDNLWRNYLLHEIGLIQT